jgi:hypothetical protein
LCIDTTTHTFLYSSHFATAFSFPPFILSYTWHMRWPLVLPLPDYSSSYIRVCSAFILTISGGRMAVLLMRGGICICLPTRHVPFDGNLACEIRFHTFVSRCSCSCS